MKSFFKTAMLLVAGILSTVQAFSANNYVTVTGTDGIQKSFALSGYPVVTFTSGNVVITAGSESVEYPLSGCIDVQLTEDDRTGTSTAVNAIDAITNNGQNAVFRFGDAVTASGLKAGTRLAVYSVDGQLVGSAKVSESGSVSVPLNAGKGIFVVKGEGTSFKFIKK